jgi:hypothetical protein
LTYLERQKGYGPDKLRWEEVEEAEEKIKLKQYVSLRSKGRHNKQAWKVLRNSILQSQGRSSCRYKL